VLIGVFPEDLGSLFVDNQRKTVEKKKNKKNLLSIRYSAQET
jgi:hypothetical protein